MTANCAKKRKYAKQSFLYQSTNNKPNGHTYFCLSRKQMHTSHMTDNSSINSKNSKRKISSKLQTNTHTKILNYFFRTLASKFKY